MKVIVILILVLLPATCVGQDWYDFSWKKESTITERAVIKTQQKCKTIKNKRGKYIKKCYTVKNRSKYNGKRVPGY